MFGMHAKINFSKITEHIYVGTNMCCQTHFEEELLEKGIEADISLEEDRVDAPFGVKFYLWLPVKDQTPPTEEQLELGIRTLDQLISWNKKVYIHCKNGHGRAPTLVAAYLMKSGMSVKEAIALLKEKRPAVHLHDSQIAALEKFKV